MKNILFSFTLILLLSGCCGDIEELLTEGITCRDEIFTETKKIGFTFDYIVNTTNSFAEVNTVTANDIRRALKVPDNNFTLKQIEVTSGKIDYSRFEDNQSAAIFLNVAITANTFNQLLLLKSNQLLPLIDIPATPFNKAVKINEFFNTEGIKGLKDLLRDYVLLLNDDGISFALVGESSPRSTLAHFKLSFTLYVTVVYEVCKYVPLGQGERACD